MEEEEESDRSDFNALLKLLVNHGVECAKLVSGTSTECVIGAHQLLTEHDILNYSCIDTSAFITALFVQELNAESDILFDQVKGKYENYEELMDESFENMKCTWFSLINDIGGHECNLIVISPDEIYFIDYYMETKRDKLFRIIKFNDIATAKDLIDRALFKQDEVAFTKLFDFQSTAEKDRYGVETTCNIFDITELPSFSRLQTLWEQSLPILLDDFNEMKANLEKRKNLDKFWSKFKKTSEEYDFETEYNKIIAELEDKYYEYLDDILELSQYYTVL
jgi:hypothetical protein